MWMANRTYPQNEVYAEGHERIFGKRDVLNKPVEEKCKCKQIYPGRIMYTNDLKTCAECGEAIENLDKQKDI